MKKSLFILIICIGLLFSIGFAEEHLPKNPVDPYHDRITNIMESVRIPARSFKASKAAENKVSLVSGGSYSSPSVWKVEMVEGTAPYKYSYVLAKIPDSGNETDPWDPVYALLDVPDATFSYTFLCPDRYRLFVTVIDANNVGYYLYSSECRLTEDSAHPSVQTRVNQLAAQCLQSCATDFDRTLWMYDYVTEHTTYDLTLSRHAALDVFFNGCGVCDSYSKALVLLLRAVGIDSGRVTGGDHAWVIAKLNGEWYMFDPTWDDPTISYTDPPCSGEESHMYFGLTTDLLEFNHVIQEYDAGYEHECTAHANNYAYHTGDAALWLEDCFTDQVSVYDQLNAALDAGGLSFDLKTVDISLNHDAYYALYQCGNPLIWTPVSWVISEHFWALDGVQIPVTSVFDVNSKSIRAQLDFERMNTLVLPSGTRQICSEAFVNDSAITRVVLPNTAESLGSKSFAQCGVLMCAEIPASVKSIADDCFAGSRRVTVLCDSGSYAQSWAIKNHVKYVCR